MRRPTTRMLVAELTSRDRVKAVAELRAGAGIDSDRLAGDQESRKAGDVHLECAVPEMELAHEGSVEAPVPQDDALHAESAGIGRARRAVRRR